jgi:hypothetical protein
MKALSIKAIIVIAPTAIRSLMIVVSNLALIYQAQERLNEAEVLELEVVDTKTRVLGPVDPETLASVVFILASIYKAQGQVDKAEVLEIQAMESTIRVLGPEHPYSLAGIGNLASTYRDQGRLEKGRDTGVTGGGDEDKSSRTRAFGNAGQPLQSRIDISQSGTL